MKRLFILFFTSIFCMSAIFAEEMSVDNISRYTEDFTYSFSSTISESSSENAISDSSLYAPQSNTGYIYVESDTVEYNGLKYNGVKMWGNSGAKNDYSWYTINNDSFNNSGFLLYGDYLTFKVLGDGKVYKIELKNVTKRNAEGQGCVYSYTFQTKKNKIVNVKIPISRLVWQQWSCPGKFSRENTTTFSLCVDTPGIYPNQDFSITAFDFAMDY